MCCMREWQQQVSKVTQKRGRVCGPLLCLLLLSLFPFPLLYGLRSQGEHALHVVFQGQWLDVVIGVEGGEMDEGCTFSMDVSEQVLDLVWEINPEFRWDRASRVMENDTILDSGEHQGWHVRVWCVHTCHCGCVHQNAILHSLQTHLSTPVHASTWTCHHLYVIIPLLSIPLHLSSLNHVPHSLLSDPHTCLLLYLPHHVLQVPEPVTLDPLEHHLPGAWLLYYVLLVIRCAHLLHVQFQWLCRGLSHSWYEWM